MRQNEEKIGENMGSENKESFLREKKNLPPLFLVSFLSKPTTHTFPSPLSLKKEERTGKRKLPAAAAKEEKEEEGKEKGFSPPGADTIYVRGSSVKTCGFPPKRKLQRKNTRVLILLCGKFHAHGT